MPSSDDVIPVALALYNSPRRYALLIGSGISRDTGIFTASEITDDIIRQIAGNKIQSGQKPQDWYKETHEDRAPTFSSLFGELTKSDEDRTAILRQYFEPVDSNKKPLIIEPTPAHLSIARLVRDGIISMIITTNFDPLLEEAIRRETGKIPLVITHRSDPRFMEVAGDHCRIVMVNGRYPTTDLKLTPEDLAKYDEKLAEYLARIFSEYGLIICGWSGEHDTGLVNILKTDRVRRFAYFWCSRDSPEKIPEEIKSVIPLATVGIRSANEFFGDLESGIDLLRRHERKTSLTVEGAIKKVKDALRDPRPDLILSDLLHDETDRVLAEVDRTNFVPEGLVEGKTCFKNRLEELERESAPLAAMVATVAFYDDGDFSDLLTETIDRLINLQMIDESFLRDGQRIHGILGTELNKNFHKIRLYPALLIIYASGIAAVHKENFNSLAAILEKPRARRFSGADMAWKDIPFFDEVNIWNTLWTPEQWTLEYSSDRFGKTGDPYYYPIRVIQAIISNLIPNALYFEVAFDNFEYLFELSYLNQTSGNPTQDSFPLMSRVWLKTVGFSGTGKVKFPDSLISYLSNIGQKIEKSDFFHGDAQRFLWCMWKYGKIIQVTPPKTDIPHPMNGFPGL